MTTWLGSTIPGCKSERTARGREEGVIWVELCSLKKTYCNVNPNISEHDLIWKQDHWYMLLVNALHIDGLTQGECQVNMGVWDWRDSLASVRSQKRVGSILLQELQGSMDLSTSWFQISSLQNYKIIHLFCFMPSSLWHFVMAALVETHMGDSL